MEGAEAVLNAISQLVLGRHIMCMLAARGKHIGVMRVMASMEGEHLQMTEKQPVAVRQTFGHQPVSLLRLLSVAAAVVELTPVVLVEGPVD